MSLVLLRYLTSNLIVKGLDNFQCPHLSTNGGFISSLGPSSDVLPQAVLEFDSTVFCTSVKNVETNNVVKGQLSSLLKMKCSTSATLKCSQRLCCKEKAVRFMMASGFASAAYF